MIRTWLEKLRGKDDEEFFWVSRESRRRNARRHGALKGSRDHVGRMSTRRKAPPSLATHLAVPTPTGIARVWHPDYLRKVEEARADAVSDAGEGGRR